MTNHPSIDCLIVISIIYNILSPFEWKEHHDVVTDMQYLFLY